MKNYVNNYKIKKMELVEIPERDYTSQMMKKKEYIKLLSQAVIEADCGWDQVVYKAMRHRENVEIVREYMVLCVESSTARWVPIDGDSKACMFSELGENIW